MAKPVEVKSPADFNNLLKPNTTVVAFFYAKNHEACQNITPYYEQLSQQLSGRNGITFIQIDKDSQSTISSSYEVSSAPTFIIFKNGRKDQKISGGNIQQLDAAVKKLAADASSSKASGGDSSASGSSWLGATLPRGSTDITDQIEPNKTDARNWDTEFAAPRTLFSSSKPEAIGKGKEAGSSASKADWVETDVDPQLMMWFQFNGKVDVHAIQLTSLAPREGDEDYDEDESPMRPKTIKIFPKENGLVEWDDVESRPGFESTIPDSAWDSKTGTAVVEIRKPTFNGIYSLAIFIKDGDGESERTRIDRIRVLGSAGAGDKRDQGPLQKIGDDD